MGASDSKVKVQQETQLKPDNISTVSMALDGPNKPKARQQMPPANNTSTVPTPGGNGQVVYSTISKCPSPSNPSPAVRFNNRKNASSLGPSSDRTMDLNGNHFYPNSLGKSSVSSNRNAGRCTLLRTQCGARKCQSQWHSCDKCQSAIQQAVARTASRPISSTWRA